jgi:hypothetical protein
MRGGRGWFLPAAVVLAAAPSVCPVDGETGAERRGPDNWMVGWAFAMRSEEAGS